MFGDRVLRHWFRALCGAFVLVFFPSLALAQAANGGPLTLVVDLTDAPRDVLHARLTVPVSGGPFTLVYPKWIPGEHSPTGPITEIAAVSMRSDGKTVAWHRDRFDMYALHIDVPAGAKTLDVSYDYFMRPQGDSSTANLAMVEWNEVVMYPQGARASDVTVSPSVVLPAAWKYATALTPTAASGLRVNFAPVSLETLVDSPLATGRYFRQETLLNSGGFSNELDLFADAPEQLLASPAKIDAFRRLVTEADLLYGARHWRHYHFLVTLTDDTAHFGLEHHESSDDRTFGSTLIDDDRFALGGDLLPHEYTHSWNGKYRRPVGLATPDYQTPMRDDLLWVYEGLTQYLGQVLSFRSGIRTLEDYPDYVASVAAMLDSEPGRATRPLIDTAVAIPVSGGGGAGYGSLRRGSDYYPEGAMIWLEADQIIRAQTGGRRSLDDFCRAFLGGTTTPPRVVPYTRDDVIAALNAIAPYDWRTFFLDRVDRVRPRLSLAGIESSGWRLTYNDRPTKYITLRNRLSHMIDVHYSLGLVIGEQGRIIDVYGGTPAATAALGPGMSIVAIDGRRYTSELVHDAIVRGKTSTSPIAMIVDDGGTIRTMSIDYHGGDRYPHLERIAGAPDRLMPSVQPRAAHPRSAR